MTSKMKTPHQQKKGLLTTKFLKLNKKIVDCLNDYKVKKKLWIIYIGCVLAPLIITDSMILTIVVRADRANTQYELGNISNIARYNLISVIDEAEAISNSVYTNAAVNDFLNRKYETPLDYYAAYKNILRGTWMMSGTAVKGIKVTMYADNASIINGGGFWRLDDKVRKSQWYQYLKNSGQDRVLYIYFDTSETPVVNPKRKISLIRKQNFYQYGNCEKIMKIDLDYSLIVNQAVKMNYDAPIYVCHNNHIVFSNTGHSSIGKDFDEFKEWRRIGHIEKVNVLGENIVIYVLNREQDILHHIIKNGPLLVFLILLNGVLPWIFMKAMNHSFTERIFKLCKVFEKIEDEKLQEISPILGRDEIGILMISYNRMAAKINELIQTVYKDKLKEQEINIARQNAELLALHSQINPHFLFNALESIRMHSVLKQENETARMVEKLARMQRQYVNWSEDCVTIKEEKGIVEAYLELQKYRFGDRLSYKIEIEEECLDYKIPQLTLVTFVENACIHGIENKSTPGWIFVRAYKKQDELWLEIEDTGSGIEEPFLSELEDRMNHVEIADLKKKKNIGIVNACLRLRMITKNKARFELESEEGAGTIVTAKIPLEGRTKNLL